MCRQAALRTRVVRDLQYNRTWIISGRWGKQTCTRKYFSRVRTTRRLTVSGGLPSERGWGLLSEGSEGIACLLGGHCGIPWHCGKADVSWTDKHYLPFRITCPQLHLRAVKIKWVVVWGRQTPTSEGRPPSPPQKADPPTPFRMYYPDMVNRQLVRILLECILIDTGVDTCAHI